MDARQMQVGCGGEKKGREAESRLSAQATTLPGCDIFWDGSTSLLEGGALVANTSLGSLYTCRANRGQTAFKT